jgi:hypothetical protein
MRSEGEKGEREKTGTVGVDGRSAEWEMAGLGGYGAGGTSTSKGHARTLGLYDIVA